MKTLVRAVVAECSAEGREEMQQALLEAALAKNQLSRRHGYSPTQHVLGQDVRLPSSVADAPKSLTAHEEVIQDGGFSKRMQMRQAARMAWAKFDNEIRVRKALLRPAKEPAGPFLAGMQVYFWRRAGTGKSKFKGRRRQDADRWFGPGVVLAAEGSMLVANGLDCSATLAKLLICPPGGLAPCLATWCCAVSGIDGAGCL